MRYVIIKSEVNGEGTLTLFAAHKSYRKGSKTSIEWIDTKEAVSNTIDPDECDFLSFEEESEAQDLLEETENDNLDNIVILGVDA